MSTPANNSTIQLDRNVVITLIGVFVSLGGSGVTTLAGSTSHADCVSRAEVELMIARERETPHQVTVQAAVERATILYKDEMAELKADLKALDSKLDKLAADLPRRTNP